MYYKRVNDDAVFHCTGPHQLGHIYSHSGAEILHKLFNI